MIEARGLTKRYGSKTAVDDLSFTVEPGHVTGFLGPNGAGKSTTMRMVMGLDRPSGGQVTVSGRRYAQHRAPLQEVGALLEARAVHRGRSAQAHLMALARTEGIPKRRVHEVLDLVGLSSVARKRVGGFSLGMGQRLGIAVALLGDPRTILLDEPVNGLDPDGVLWIRNLLKHLASEGRAVFVSSHLMSEMALTAEHLVVIGRGRLLADTTVAELIATAQNRPVAVRSPHAADVRARMERGGATVTDDGAGTLQVTGMPAEEIGVLAAEHGLVLHELHTQSASLEDAYMELTRSSREYLTGDDGTESTESTEEAAR